MCGLIAEGHSLRDIEAMKGLPSKAGIMKWLLEGEAYKAAGKLDNSKAQFVQYALAREVQADLLADEIISIADDSQFNQTTTGGARSIFYW